MTVTTPEQLSASPEFQQLLGLTLELVTAQAPLIRDTNTEQRRAYADRANALSAAVKSGAATTREEVYGDLGELFGLTAAEARSLAQRVQGAAKEFTAAFPDFTSMDEQGRMDLVSDAVKRDPAVLRAAQVLTTPAAGPTTAECLVSCHIWFIIFVSAAIAFLIAGVVACAILFVVVPLMILCIVAAVAAFAALMALLLDFYTSCIAGCKEAGPGQGN